eukprot:gene11554-12813_t
MLVSASLCLLAVPSVMAGDLNASQIAASAPTIADDLASCNVDLTKK